ncbi:MAG: J domain-containing protein [Coprobacter sp.]|nr:J domain-containing protein [Coprobacter sp.]
MEFKDYYKILDIPESATFDEVKRAYRRLSLLYHPDKNPGKDTTSIMQDINEAYCILKDDLKRERYDNEYQIFKRTVKREDISEQNYHNNSDSSNNTECKWTYHYDVSDEDVRQDVYNARNFAKELIDKFLNNLKEDSIKAAKGAWSEMQGYIIVAIIWVIIGLIIMSLI